MRTRYRLTLKQGQQDDAAVLFDDVIWAEEQAHSDQDTGRTRIVLVYDLRENPKVDDALRTHRLAFASWVPI